MSDETTTPVTTGEETTTEAAPMNDGAAPAEPTAPATDPTSAPAENNA